MIDGCLANLDKICSLDLAGFRPVNESMTAANQSSPLKDQHCAYTLNYRPNATTTNDDFTVMDSKSDSACRGLLTTNLNDTSSMNGCFNRTRIGLGIEPISSECQVNFGAGSDVFMANSTVKCVYENETLADVCRVEFLTTTTTTLPTTTSSTTSSTTSTTTTTTPSTTTTTTTTTTVIYIN